MVAQNNKEAPPHVKDLHVETEKPKNSKHLHVSDLEKAVKIIDVCAHRGAFDEKEMRSISLLRKRFAEFISEYYESH